MALNVILICLTAVSALNALLVWDLYNRSRRLAMFANQITAINQRIAHLISNLKG